VVGTDAGRRLIIALPAEAFERPTACGSNDQQAREKECSFSWHLAAAYCGGREFRSPRNEGLASGGGVRSPFAGEQVPRRVSRNPIRQRTPSQTRPSSVRAQGA